ncbi:MAG: hypothetical protein JWM73_2418 [Solirubrobacterales bacterium]|jgi:hypothetical protein|nr:hypothetical protein [Solirubrobacterales bacterium]
MDDDPEQAIERMADELDERVGKLEDSIEQAKEASTAADIAGDWDQTDDQAGGEDPVGAHEERDEPSE